uniref:Triple QxxK/R motif-containing protein n=1 Tax=Rhabditophanes sp. KR3021 TaxID=114890 RepID=A0AC35U0B4_9BILA
MSEQIEVNVIKRHYETEEEYQALNLTADNTALLYFGVLFSTFAVSLVLYLVLVKYLALYEPTPKKKVGVDELEQIKRIAVTSDLANQIEKQMKKCFGEMKIHIVGGKNTYFGKMDHTKEFYYKANCD